MVQPQFDDVFAMYPQGGGGRSQQHRVQLARTVYISALDSSDSELVPLPQMPRFVFRITPRALSCNITAHFDSSRHTFIEAQHAVF